MISLEAIACGRPVITYVSSEYPQYKDFPMKDLREEEEIVEAVMSATTDLWRRQYAYLERNHGAENVIPHLLKIYRSLADEDSG